MLPNDEDKKISIENETRDAARIRLERRQASKKGASFDDGIFDLSGRSAHRPMNAQDTGGDHAGSHNSHSRMHGRSFRSDYRGVRYVAASLSSLSSIPRSVVICVVAVLVIFSLMVVASSFGHTPEIASLDTFEEVESVPGEDGDASGDAEIADFSLLPAGLDAKTRESLEAQSDDPRIVSIVNNVVALGKTGEHYQQKMLELAAKDPEALDYVADFPDRYPASSGAAYSDTVARGSVPDLKQWDQRWGLCRVLRRRSWFYGMLPHVAFYGLYGAHGQNRQVARRHGHPCDRRWVCGRWGRDHWRISR